MGPRQEAGLTFRIAVVATWLVLITPAACAAQLQATRGDDQIRVRIEQWFSDRQLPGITVAVHQGEVTLGGTVLNAWARRQAAEHARNVEGVKSVTDELVGRVTLTGMVDSEVAWRAAEAIARGVSGVISVDNTLMTIPATS